MLTTLTGFFISALVFYILNAMFPVRNMDQVDSVDIYGTFSAAEARRMGVTLLEEASRQSVGNIVLFEDGKSV